MTLLCLDKINRTLVLSRKGIKWSVATSVGLHAFSNSVGTKNIYMITQLAGRQGQAKLGEFRPGNH